jgi:hypothetical protein
MNGEGRTDLPKFNLVAHPLFKGVDFSKVNYDRPFELFFRPVLAMRPMQEKFPLTVNTFTVVIPESTLRLIQTSLKTAGLSAHEGFFLFLICKIQEAYARDIAFFDTPEERKRIDKYPTELENLRTVLQNTDIGFGREPSERLPPKLEAVSFKFNTENTVKISDDSLLHSISCAIKEHFDRGNLGDWRKRLNSLPPVWHENQMPNAFRFKICKALHNLLKETRLFDFQDKATTDQEIRAIGEILRYSLVPFRDRQNDVLDYDADWDKIKSQIRSAISRQPLQYPDTFWPKDRLNIDTERLKRFFDADFIDCGESPYPVFDIRTVATITHRFDLNPIVGDLVHIFSCLGVRHFQLGHQFSALISTPIEKNSDYKSWSTLFKMPTTPTAIKNVSITLEGGETLNFQEYLSLSLLQNAILEFRDDHQYEFEFDFYESKVRPIPDSNGAFGLDITGQLHQPQNRFLPRFCRQCFEYLKNADPNYNDGITDFRYYEVIGQLLLDANYFSEQQHSDQFVASQVKKWIKNTN